MANEIIRYDVVIIGAGPAGLATAIRLKQLSLAKKVDLSVAILEKGSNVGANIVSGCIMDPRGLDELLPNWHELGLPVNTLVKTEQICYLGKHSSIKLPTPKKWSNNGN